MAFCRLVFPLLVLSVICINASNVPLFMWGDIPRTSIESSPLITPSTPEFEGILKQELAGNPLTIAFIEETLSVEDFSRKNSEGKTAFPYLHDNVRKAIYLPSVENALPTLNEIADGSKSDHITLTENGLSEEIAPESDEGRKFVFINLRDAMAGESRFEMLERHNKFIQNTLAEVRKREPKVVAIYTAQYPSWVIPVTHSRSRRAVNARNVNQTLFIMDSLRLYTTNITVTNETNSFVLEGFTTAITTIAETNTSMTTKMTFSNAMVTLGFNQKQGYWYFENVTLELPSETPVALHPVEDVFAILGFSYRCMQSATFQNMNQTNATIVQKYTLTFKDIKIQPFMNSSALFGDSFNCVGFFSAPIWASLFVVFLLLSITFYGIMMMMDIRTMDRFDDPKGKTITINAGE